MDYNKLALELHKLHGGKISISLKDQIQDLNKLSAYYTPGVAAVSKAIEADEQLLPVYTWTNNLVAIISDGSAVLGLGDIGPKASMPVMEGKALLFKYFAGVDSVPITLNVHSVDEIVSTIKAIAPSFGAINLEDIAAPKCFEIEERLKSELDIPVFHDDQHGTAIVVLAGLINSLKVTNKQLPRHKIVISGAGAAGVAIAKLIHLYSNLQKQSPRIIAVDSKGIINQARTDLNDSKKILLNYVDRTAASGSLADAMNNADTFIGVSAGGLLNEKLIKLMSKNPVIFALANPTPEIMPDLAIAAGAAIVATGRTDFPNQINNALAFPGIFKGALQNRVQAITDEHKISIAQSIASLVANPTKSKIIPSVFDKKLVHKVASVFK